MCGISGIAKLNRNSINWNELPKINNILSHRGPDDEGYTFFTLTDYYTIYGKNTPDSVKSSNINYAPKKPIESITPDAVVGLGHRRLSIIDTSELGHQPMCDTSKNYWLTYNGEIYNYLSLREELQKKGYQFLTNTDTEVLLYSYIEWKEKCLDKLDGMWAFCIYDRAANKLFGARDRFGVKPFYYFRSKLIFAFASEIKALVELKEYKKELNQSAVFDYLVLGRSELQNESLFKGIYELPPSYYFNLDLSQNNFTTSKYYKLKYDKSFGKFNQLEFDKHISHIKELLKTSIKEHLQADVPIGTCLSGGIDSSAIVGSIDSIIKGKNQNVFTASYENEIDETKWAKKVVDNTNTNWIKCFPKPKGWLEDFEALVYAQDLPFFSTSTYAQYKVMKSVKEMGVKVTLDGQGADELFTGYEPHFSCYMHQAFTTGNLDVYFNELTHLNNGFAKASILKYSYKKLFSNFFKTYFKKQGFKKIHVENQYINAAFWDSNKNQFDLIMNEPINNLNKFLHYQTTGSDLKVLFRTGDRNAMHHSVESRVPFADNKKLTEYLFQIPAVYKIQNGNSKVLLREAFKDYLPTEIYNRQDKIGFSTPEKDWFKQNSKQLVDLLPDQPDEFVNWKDIKTDWDKLLDHACNTYTVRLWRMINFALWRNVFKT